MRSLALAAAASSSPARGLDAPSRKVARPVDVLEQLVDLGFGLRAAPTKATLRRRRGMFFDRVSFRNCLDAEYNRSRGSVRSNRASCFWLLTWRQPPWA